MKKEDIREKTIKYYYERILRIMNPKEIKELIKKLKQDGGNQQ